MKVAVCHVTYCKVILSTSTQHEAVNKEYQTRK